MMDIKTEGSNVAPDKRFRVSFKYFFKIFNRWNSIHCYNEQLDEKEDTYLKVISKLSQVANYKFSKALMCTVEKKIIMVDFN